MNTPNETYHLVVLNENIDSTINMIKTIGIHKIRPVIIITFSKHKVKTTASTMLEIKSDLIKMFFIGSLLTTPK